MPTLQRLGRMGIVPKMAEPTAPYVRPIMELHRGPDAFVTFHRKRGEILENLGSVRTAELETIFPEFVAELERDSYFSVNSFWRIGYYGTCLPMLKPAFRKAEGARYLNACFIDIDFHDQTGQFDFGYHFGQVITLQDRKIIPPASLVMRSGRGIWLFWLLADSKIASLPPRAFPEQVLAYNAIELELTRRTNADKAAHDVARITRVPGSINSKAGDTMRVMYWPQYDATGRAYVYTLESLAGFLDIELPQRRRAGRVPESSPEASARGLRGWQALWQHRFEDFQVLREMRGSFSKGCRNGAALMYAVILRGNGMKDSVVRQQLEKMGGECSPPLTASEISGAIQQSNRSRGQIRDSTIADYLKITPEEAQYVPRWADRRALPEIECSDLNLKYSQRAEHRRKAIKEILDLLGRVPSCREMADLLRQRGIQISYVQVSRDYRELHLNQGSPTAPRLFPAVSDVTLVGEGRRGGGNKSRATKREPA
ncbi:MAG: hypothetical protein WCA10_05385 [Terracidiphilus sp.]